eukprot:TRINITY_DN8541_c0_g1::TRINITY_DN8541_c0_g1_i1::g.8657::m.8657 TRINITY_DN8541_c0_g1::TRINITY_DN8541_c0_g1_i1::g.8657  ORF type:complete len:586 (-),score=6.54,PMP22_Claudin/PF00822.15/0.34 TRINITY_DN8541_c0_g1_i1:709-2466(-)
MPLPSYHLHSKEIPFPVFLIALSLFCVLPIIGLPCFALFQLVWLSSQNNTTVTKFFLDSVLVCEEKGDCFHVGYEKYEDIKNAGKVSLIFGILAIIFDSIIVGTFVLTRLSRSLQPLPRSVGIFLLTCAVSSCLCLLLGGVTYSASTSHSRHCRESDCHLDVGPISFFITTVPVVVLFVLIYRNSINRRVLPVTAITVLSPYSVRYAYVQPCTIPTHPQVRYPYTYNYDNDDNDVDDDSGLHPRPPQAQFFASQHSSTNAENPNPSASSSSAHRYISTQPNGQLSSNSISPPSSGSSFSDPTISSTADFAAMSPNSRNSFHSIQITPSPSGNPSHNTSMGHNNTPPDPLSAPDDPLQNLFTSRGSPIHNDNNSHIHLHDVYRDVSRTNSENSDPGGQNSTSSLMHPFSVDPSIGTGGVGMGVVGTDVSSNHIQNTHDSTNNQTLLSASPNRNQTHRRASTDRTRHHQNNISSPSSQSSSFSTRARNAQQDISSQEAANAVPGREMDLRRSHRNGRMGRGMGMGVGIDMDMDGIVQAIPLAAIPVATPVSPRHDPSNATCCPRCTRTIPSLHQSPLFCSGCGFRIQ